MDRLLSDPQGMSQDIHSWAGTQGLLIDFMDSSSNKGSSIPSVVAVKRRLGESVVPVVMAHGMGDSCFNDGMQHITQHVSDLLGGCVLDLYSHWKGSPRRYNQWVLFKHGRIRRRVCRIGACRSKTCPWLFCDWFLARQ